MLVTVTSIKSFLCRNDVKTIILCSVTGGILQILSRQYLAKHPEILKDEPVPKNKYKLPKFFWPRGGAFIEISVVSLKFLGPVLIDFLAKKGLLAGIITGAGLVISKIPLTAVSTYLRDTLPQNLPELEKKKFILINGEKVYFDSCDQNFKYLIKVLEDPMVPFEDKKEITRQIFTKYLNLKTPSGRVNFILCIVFVLYILSIQNQSGFYIMMKNIIKAIQEGRISKAMGRIIVRRLKKKGLDIDPELLEVVRS